MRNIIYTDKITNLEGEEIYTTHYRDAISASGLKNIEFLDIPKWACKIIITVAELKQNTTGFIKMRVGYGNNSTYLKKGYFSCANTIGPTNSNHTSNSTNTDAFYFIGTAAARIYTGHIEMYKCNENRWIGTSVFSSDSSQQGVFSVTVGDLNKLQIIPHVTTSQFTQGHLSISYI